MMRTLILCAAFLAIGCPVSALDEISPSDVSPIKVRVLDYASGGCWTNIREAKSYAEDQISLVGLEVAQGDQRPRALFLLVVRSQRDEQGYCWGSIAASVSGPALWDGKEVMASVLDDTVNYVHRQNGNIFVLDFIKDFVSGRLRDN